MPEHWETVIRVDKLSAAERQLKTAIRLFFGKGDPVAVHSLACSALQVLSDLLLSDGAGGVSRNPHLIVAGHWKEWIAAMKGDENFLKHADRDPKEYRDFNTITTVASLLEASFLFEVVAQRVEPETRLFQIWASKAYPAWYTGGNEEYTRALGLLDEHDFAIWLLALDEPTGKLARTFRSWKPPPKPTTPFDLYLNSNATPPSRPAETNSGGDA